jgi:cytoskeletal protein CcmA (bactofilin family)
MRIGYASRSGRILKKPSTLVQREEPVFSQSNSHDKTSRDSNQSPAAGAKPKGVSTLAPDMTVTGNITCEGAAQILGKVVGDIQATEVLVGEGAQVEGNITAREVAINGSFKGTIRGHAVKLRGKANVDGEVFSNSLTVEENVLFEGVSRRLDKLELQRSPQPVAPAAKNAPIADLRAAPEAKSAVAPATNGRSPVGP